MVNYQHIYLPMDDTEQWKNLRHSLVNSETKSEWSQLARIPTLIKVNSIRSNSVLKTQPIQNLLKSNQKFDLFVLGYNFNHFHLGIAAHFKCPSVVISTVITLKPLLDLIGNPSEISSTLIFPYQRVEKITFSDRFWMFFGYAIELVFTTLMRLFISLPYYDENFPRAKGYPTLSEVEKNVSLILVNHHFSEGGIRPFLPNYIQVGGIEISPTPKPLSEVKLNKTNSKFLVFKFFFFNFI